MKRFFIFVAAMMFLMTGCSNVEVVDKGTTYMLDRMSIDYEDGKFVDVRYQFESPESPFAYAGIYYVNDEKIGQENYTRDDKGNILSIVKDWNTDETVTYTYTYDDKGRVIEKMETMNNILQSKTIIVYGENGKEEKIEVYDSGNVLLYYQEFVYEESSKCMVTQYNANGKLTQYKKQTYAYMDKVVKEEVYTAEDKLVSTTIWYYVPHSTKEYYIGVEPTEQ